MTIADKLLCTVYRASRESELYVYVRRDEGLTRIPGELQSRLGKLSEVMTLALTADRKLARAKAADVMTAIADKGYYLQLPPDFNPARFTLGG
ncbi:MAG TPA: YcgL domain-containing protein [Candidatus Acidoferrum sp.]|nr:YcgL domain-containing protein [Candidatus Acidoferrum sp.]